MLTIWSSDKEQLFNFKKMNLTIFCFSIYLVIFQYVSLQYGLFLYNFNTQRRP